MCFGLKGLHKLWTDVMKTSLDSANYSMNQIMKNILKMFMMTTQPFTLLIILIGIT